jgi:hypothetical protein
MPGWTIYEEGDTVGHMYKVIFSGLSVAGTEEEARLLAGLRKKFNLTPEKAERLLQRVPVVVKKGESMEELEKYVKAFEEIGGKVRMEEVTPESAEVTGPPPPEMKTHAEKMIACPECAFEQPEAEACVKCGLSFSKTAMVKEGVSALGEQAQTAPYEEAAAETSEESREGFLSALFNSIKGALFSPSKFFRTHAVGEGVLSPLMIGVICGIIGLGASILWNSFLWQNFSHYLPISSFPFDLYVIYSAVSLPVRAVLLILANSVITHLCLMVVGGSKRGFRTTFRIVCYAATAYLFLLVPFLGFIIEIIYLRVLIIIGAREGHGISTGRAVFAILLPLILLVGLGLIAGIFMSLFLGSLRIFSGTGTGI